MGIDAYIDAVFKPVAEKSAEIIFYAVPIMGGHEIKLILVWLVLAALFFTFYLGFINIRYFKHAICLLCKKSDDKEEGQISPFRALATSLSGTVGLGNIAGVAVAISLGGPGAAFWMVLMGLFGMSTKFAEVTLGVKYRKYLDPKDPDKVSGGPMYYLKDAFIKLNMPRLGTFMGGFFAVCIALGALGGGSLFQTNQVFQQAVNISGGDASILVGKGWMVGLFIAGIVGIVIIGGIKSIASVAGRLVPAMAGIYMLACFAVFATHFDAIPAAFVTIVTSALSPQAGMGAFIGALLMGVQRACFSNEAGMGSAAIAHSAAQTDDPVKQGMVGMLGPFIDTILICLMTALVITVTGVYGDADGSIQGVELTSQAFAQGASWFPYVLFVVVFLFAYSTLISWSYYGVKGFTFIFGENALAETIYRLIFCGFIVIGASADLSSVILFTDASFFAMAIPNIIGLYMLAPELKRDVKAYAAKLKAG
jgi:AGCS family alanine or glycine:cation symporter